MGSGLDYDARDNILEYDPETKQWTQIGTMREARHGHAVTVVDYEDYVDFCIDDDIKQPKSEVPTPEQ